MRISDIFRRKPPSGPRVLMDPYFGEIKLDKDLWIGRIDFPPIQGQVDFGLKGGEEGPTQEQRDLFQRIVGNYGDLREQYRSFFLSNYYGTTRDGATGEELFDSQALQYIELPTITDAPTSWEMAYTTDLEDHIMTPRFTDMTFLDEGWDG